MNSSSALVDVSAGAAARLSPTASWRDATKCEHFVQFYEDDSFLVKSVAGFISEGFRRGESVLVIVTQKHREALHEALRAGGFDLAAAREQGHYLALDAGETLSKFMVEGVLDEKLFQFVIGGAMERVAQAGKGLRAFGEMVALLWSSGNTEAAIRLEEFWNNLAKAHSFSLFCAYPLGGFSKEVDGKAFVHICKEHSLVIPAESYSTRSQSDDRLRAISLLQQQANALRAEVAERKRIETELRHSREELAGFIENTSIGLHRAGLDGIIQWANQADMDLLGYSKEEYCGHHIAEFHADKEVIDDILARLERGEKISNYEARMKCKDGSIKHVLIDSSVYRKDGQFIHTQCFTRDITAQKLAENATRYLAAIVESSDDAIISKTLEGVIRTWNQGAEKLFGYTAKEVIGKPVTILIPADKSDEEPNILGRILHGQKIDHYETIRRRKDGSLVEISLTVSPIKDSAGRVIGASKIARDITERKRNEQALRDVQERLALANQELESRVLKRTRELQESNNHLETFVYSIAHDLRSPLRAMEACSKMLLDEYGRKLDAPGQEYVSRINHSAEFLDKLLLGLLDYSRNATLETELVPIDVQTAWDNAALQCQDQIIQNSASVTVIPPLPLVRAHAATLTQVLTNLLSNAIRFTPAGVRPEVRFHAEDKDTWVRLWVEDNGIGIAPEHHARIFRLFERLHGESYGGTGIGLALVRKAIERMGGRVGLESSPGQGSRFWVELRKS